MAKKLDAFPGRPTADYPWDEWLDGSVWLLEAGSDFTAPISSFRAQVHGAAKDREIKARTKTQDKDLIVQAIREPGSSTSA